MRRRYTGDGNGNSNGNGCFDRTALRAVQDGGFAANRERLTATTGNVDGNGWEWGRQRLGRGYGKGAATKAAPFVMIRIELQDHLVVALVDLLHVLARVHYHAPAARVGRRARQRIR